MMTQQFSQKYTIIQLLEEVEDGTIYSSNAWPLHTTLVDTFAVDWSEERVVEELEHYLANVKPFSTKANGEEHFGANGEVHVILLEKTDDLSNLHSGLTDALQSGGLKLNDPQFAGEGFLPHATVQPHARLNIGDEVSYGALSLIDMFPDEDPYMRKVIKTIPFGKS